jgi:hypothetical protein
LQARGVWGCLSTSCSQMPLTNMWTTITAVRS